MRPLRWALVGLGTIALAGGVYWWSARGARGAAEIIWRAPVLTGENARPLAAGSGIFEDGRLVAQLDSVNGIPVSVNDRDSELVLSGTWMEGVQPSLTRDTTMAVIIEAMPVAGAQVTGMLGVDRRGSHVGVVRLRNPTAVLPLLYAEGDARRP